MTLFSEAFADVVKEYREAAGLSKAALAEKANLHQTYIAMLENGDRSPNINTAKAIADAFGVPLRKMIATAEKKADKFKAEIVAEREKQRSKGKVDE